VFNKNFKNNISSVGLPAVSRSPSVDSDHAVTDVYAVPGVNALVLTVVVFLLLLVLL
jgi:hypothetical protein